MSISSCFNASLPRERYTAKYVIISSWGDGLRGLVVYFLHSIQLPLPGWVCPPPPHLACSVRSGRDRPLLRPLRRQVHRLLLIPLLDPLIPMVMLGKTPYPTFTRSLCNPRFIPQRMNLGITFTASWIGYINSVPC